MNEKAYKFVLTLQRLQQKGQKLAKLFFFAFETNRIKIAVSRVRTIFQIAINSFAVPGKIKSFMRRQWLSHIACMLISIH
jgi:hypothetical protein